MSHVYFNLTLHFHQPVGNFDHVIERAYARCYLPFFELLQRHPGIKTSLHFSGCLLEWIEQHHPEFFHILRTLAGRRQVEFLTGGFYEPILIAIPDWDAQGQIRMLTDYLREKFGTEAKGAWLTERVWEPGIASKLADTGVKWTVLDDTIFRYSGVQPHDMWGYYLTEDQRKPLGIFPSAQELRYRIPFQEPQVSEEFLLRFADDWGQKLVVYGDDGEKFGEWPETHEWVYTKGWLARFFTHFERIQDRVETIHLANYVQRQKPRGRLYLPSASYEEMLGWALPAWPGQQYETLREQLKKDGRLETFEPYLHGGSWRDFLAKYPESNHLQKRVFYLSEAFHAAEASAEKRASILLEEGHTELWRAQCNCGYWHGVFGGLYLAHIRGASWQHLSRAEALFRQANGAEAGSIACQQTDLNVDGSDEVLVTADHGTTVWTPHYGGSLREWTVRPADVNVLNALTRRTEAYHERVRQAVQQHETQQAGDSAKSIHDGMRLKAEGLDEKLFADWYLRGGLVDHLLGGGTTLDGFQRCRYPELGDFVNQPYDCTVSRQQQTVILRMSRKGLMAEEPFHVAKVVVMNGKAAALEVRYTFTNSLDRERDVWYGCETTVMMPSAAGPGVYFQFDSNNRQGMQTASERESIIRAQAVDEHAGLSMVVECEEEFSVWTFPVESVSLSEGGAELTFQGASLMPHWKFRLPARGKKELVMTWKVEQKEVSTKDTKKK